MLSQKVAEGTLPPLAERLPNDPVVVEPFTDIGVYGGTARIFETDQQMFNPLEGPLTIDPLVANILPNLVERWEFSDNNQVLTLYLRAGIKWSDGAPFGADDFVFHHQHVSLDDEITPVRLPRTSRSRCIKVDELTVRYEFTEPFPFLINTLAQLGDQVVSPSKYLKQFHPAFVDRDKVLAGAREKGYVSWVAYFEAIRLRNRNEPPIAPTLGPYIQVKRTPSSLNLTRNPYYWKVDPAGNQLPYIDHIRAESIDNLEVMAAKAATGQVDFAAFALKTPDFPLFMLGRETAGIQVHVWNRLHGSDVIIMPNLTIDDDRLQPVFNDVRFRRALSVAINRAEMNSVIYFGRGEPRQATVIPTSRFFEPEFASRYTEHDPDQARRWLDEMGLKDRNQDGFREYADGEPMTITLEFFDFETPKAISLELVAAYWRDIGLDVRLKEVDQALQENRARGNLMQMTVWHADRTTDILFPIQPQWYVPMHIGWEEAHWNNWSTYFLSDGERGERPPAQILQLQGWWREMVISSNPDRVTELGKNILRSTAENVWTIGTVGLAPQPVVVSGRLRNVSTHGYWGWDNRFTMAYHPATWYLKP